MMKAKPITNLVRNIFAAIFCVLPKLRGSERIWRWFNKMIFEAGADPIVLARMKRKTLMYIDLRTHTEAIAYYRGGYDEAYIKTILDLYDPGLIFLDIGANVGFYTVAVADFIKKNNGSGKVIAFEPFHENYMRIIQNLDLNGLQDFSEVMDIGLSDYDRQDFVTLQQDFLTGAETGNTSIAINQKMDAGFKKVAVALKRLDNVLDSLNLSRKIDILKIDIEGHEDFCLKGAQKTLLLNRPTIFMEVNKPYYVSRGIDLNEAFSPLIPPSYKIYKKRIKWEEIKSFDTCKDIDNVFLIPHEKLHMSRYGIFCSD